MSKSRTSSFVVERALMLEPWKMDRLERKFNVASRIYNSGVKHAIKMLHEMRNDEQYQAALKAYKEAKAKSDDKTKQECSDMLHEIKQSYGLTEYSLQAYLAVGYQKAYKGCLGANIVQKLATELSKAVDKALYEGKKLHYRKRGQTVSFEDKTAGTGIIYHPEEDAVYINKTKYPLKPIRKKDYYLQEAMLHKIKYCRIIRKPFQNGYHYFVQFVMSGVSTLKDEHLYPTQIHKHTLGEGIIGIDEGTTDIAYYGENAIGFVTLADGVGKYNAKIHKYAVLYEHRVRINNPDCYNPDGTRIKGKKNYCHTKGMLEALMLLKNAYRKKSVFVKQSHNILTNEIISHCDTIVKEPMSFNGLAKRSKSPAQRQKKETVIKDKNGNEKTINKFKKKKRFGKSINNRSPGLFNQTLEDKITRLGGTYINVDQFEYKASQYNHLTREATKPRLSDRSKCIGDVLVQRDLYSAFLLSEMKDTKTIDFEACNKDFDKFLERQEAVIEGLIVQRKASCNFGLKDFMKEKSIA